MSDKSPQAFRTISEVAEELDLPQHVLRFWETKFSQIRPMKRSSGRRFYRPEDVELVRVIRDMLYGQGYTIRGVQKLLKQRGAKDVVATAGATPAGEPPLEDEAPSPQLAADAPSRSGADAERPVLPFDFLAELQALREEVRSCAKILEDARRA